MIKWMSNKVYSPATLIVVPNDSSITTERSVVNKSSSSSVRTILLSALETISSNSLEFLSNKLNDDDDAVDLKKIGLCTLVNGLETPKAKLLCTLVRKECPNLTEKQAIMVPANPITIHRFLSF